MSVEKVQAKAVMQASKQPMVTGIKNADKLIISIQQNMIDLMNIMQNSPDVTPEDKSDFMNIMGKYSDFVKENLGAAPGEPVKKAKPIDMVSMEAGVADVQQAI